MIYLVTNQTSFFTNDLYSIISPQEALEKLEKKYIYGLDTETLGFDPYTKELFTVQVGDEEDQFCIDTMTVDIRIFKAFFENKDRLFILHNAKFDLRFFYHKRIIIKKVYDTFLGEKLLWLGYPPGIHRMGLANLTDDYLGVQLDKTVRGAIYYEGLTDRVIKYGCDDVKYLITIREKQLAKIKEAGLNKAIGIENEFVKVLAYVEYSGLKLDIQRWQTKMEKDLNRLQKAKDQLDSWVLNHNDERFIHIERQGDLFEGWARPKCKINWNSAKQVIPLLKSLGFNLTVQDKETGEFKDSTEAPVIEAQKHISNIAEPYLEYSAAFKVVSTYGQSFIDAINPISGRLHTQFNQLMDTTRLSCGGKDEDTGQDNINFQNIPADDETRACFVPQEGYAMICADYSAQEDYVFTELSQEPQLISFYNDKTRKRDGHSFVAKLVYHKELADIAEEDVKNIRKDLRQNSKAGKFALHYGGNGMTVARNLNIPVEDGLNFEKLYFQAFPGIKKYFDIVKKQSWSQGYVLISKWTGHKAYIYDWSELKGAERRFSSEFWDIYRQFKPAYNPQTDWNFKLPQARKSIIRQFFKDFSDGKSLDEIVNKEYSFIKKNAKGVVLGVYNQKVDKPCVLVECVKHYFKRKGSSERMALNYPVQGTSAQITKIACIKYFESLIERDLLFRIWIPNIVHDEIEVEAPIMMAIDEADLVQKCMEDAASMFCYSVKLKAVPEIGDHWIH